MRLAIFALVIVFCVPVLGSAEVDPELASIFYELWKDSGFGKDPNRTERAAWIVRNGSGAGSEVIRWRNSATRNGEYWNGPMPENTVLQAHTHTDVADPKPSRKDIDLSARIGVPIYTISQRGIWMVDAAGKVSQLADREWHKAIAKDEIQAAARR